MLDTAQLTKQSVLDGVKSRRELLGLTPLTDLDANTSVKDGLTTTTASAPGRVPKVQAAADLATLREALRRFRPTRSSKDAQPLTPTRPNSARMPKTSTAYLESHS
ncbi:hypothetical protein [Microvirga brassicacearum]|uniref:hypothetical protein n=1 Tax=Microvirga brassicacearum TaxID=2580413 RepID=UPI001FCF0E06|nr:hypothetical protein [Microvirga brassicacearum]